MSGTTPKALQAVLHTAALVGLAFAIATALAAPAPARGAEPAVRGVSADEVVFGMASPFSGTNSDLGRGMRVGVEAAFAAANDAGGVHGRKLRLVAVDDGYEPFRTATAIRELVEKHRVFGFVGNVGTPTAAVSIPYATQHRAPFFGALTGAPLLRRSPPDRYVFNYRASYAEETAAAVRWLVEVRRIPPSAIALFTQQDAFGEAGSLGVVRQLARYGVEPGAIPRAGYPRNTTDVYAAIGTLAPATNVRAVVLIATSQAAIEFMRGMRAAGRPLVYATPSPVNADALAREVLRADGAEDVVVTQIVPSPASDLPGVARYRAALKKYGKGEAPGYVSLEGWAAATVLIEGLRRAGPGLDAERLVAALEAIERLDVGLGSSISFGPKEHQGSHQVWATALQANGTWKSVELPGATAAK